MLRTPTMPDRVGVRVWCPHVSGHAGVGRAGGADSGAVASGAGLARGAAPLPERAPGYRSRGRAGRGGGVRGSKGPPWRTIRRTSRGSQLAETEGVRSIRPRLGRPPRAAARRISVRCDRSPRRRSSGPNPPRRQRLPATPFGLISGGDLRILFGYRVTCFSGTLMSAWPEESTTNERMYSTWLGPR